MSVAIFDMDGVLYRGNIVLPYAKEALARLRRAGWQVFFATNNSTATRQQYVDRLNSLGLGGDLEHVVTSAYATAHYLDRLEPRPKDVLVFGANGLRQEIREVGIPVRDANDVPGIDPPPEAAAAGHGRRGPRPSPDLREDGGGAARGARGGALHRVEQGPRLSGRGSSSPGCRIDRRRDRGRDGAHGALHRQTRAVPLRRGATKGRERTTDGRGGGLDGLRHGRRAPRRRDRSAHSHRTHRAGRGRARH